jgi:uncharacterized protein GlcG (DUF336 family)
LYNHSRTGLAIEQSCVRISSGAGGRLTVAMTKTVLRIITVLIVLVSSSSPGWAQLQTRKTLSLTAAKQLVSAAEDFALKNKWNVAITLLDEGGNLLFFQRMDGVQIGSIEVSRRKAESAIKFLRPSKSFSDGVSSRPQLMVLPGAFPFEGGLPIEHEGQIIGAIGVSGVTAEQDGMIAKAAVDALKQVVAGK